MSVDEQLNLLLRRGMQTADLENARQHLLHINYYRFRAYWLPDEMPAASAGDHAFKPGTQFETVLDLYNFDRRLRLLVMDAIERIEVSLRTRWAHVLAMRYGSHAYLDAALFRDKTQHAKYLQKLREELERSHETFVTHYRKTYSDPELPPIWVVCEVLSFGQLSVWFSNLAQGHDRADIVTIYGVDEQIIKSFAHHLSYVRNVCAHHSRLWNRDLTISMKVPVRPAELGASFNSTIPKRIYNTLVMLAYLMNIISPRSQWRTTLLALTAEHPGVDLAAMGFPVGWRTSAVWDGGS